MQSAGTLHADVFGTFQYGVDLTINGASGCTSLLHGLRQGFPARFVLGKQRVYGQHMLVERRNGHDCDY